MNISVLIVDDEKELLEMYKDFLEEEGLKVFLASSGEEALQVFSENQNIMLIVSDSQMGKMSGLELLKNLQDQYAKTPYFYLATGDAEKSEEELKNLGVHRLILKPFDLDEMILQIKLDINGKE